MYRERFHETLISKFTLPAKPLDPQQWDPVKPIAKGVRSRAS
ncbi:hypothetical protein [Phormidium sp. CCY1219]|nr:hypothetical protein [Phormidium sp. CCY1219]